jgi:hypothetical protein
MKKGRKGAQHQFVHRLPGQAKYRNLVLKRGVVSAPSKCRGGVTARCSIRRSRVKRIFHGCRWIVPAAAPRR